MVTKIKYWENIHGVKLFDCPDCERGSLFKTMNKPGNLISCVVCGVKYDTNSSNVELVKQN